MQVLITGGTGFIGTRLALESLRRGHRVRVLGQRNTDTEAGNIRELEAQGVEVIRGSVTDPDLVAQAIGGSEIVFHLAAAQHEMNVPDRHFWNVNVDGTRNLLEASLRSGVRRVVHGSTIGVYGALAGEIDEDSPCRPDNIYGITKLEGEKTAVAFQDRLAVVVIRIPEVYGPGDRRLLKLFRAVARRRFYVIGAGHNLHHPIYVDDLVDGLLLAATHTTATGRTFLLAGKEAVSTNEMVSTVAEQLRVPAPRIRLPLLPFLVAAAVLEAGLRPLGIQPPLHRRRMDFFRKSFVLRATRAATTLGFQPRTGFHDGASATAAWYRRMGYL
jgi:nucleoside-diphosphate-sugar epimerase